MKTRHVTAYTDPVEVQRIVDEYFKHCEESRVEYQLKNGDIKIRYEEAASMIGLARFFEIDKATLYTYIAGEEKTGLTDENRLEIQRILRDAQARVEQTTLSRALSGDYDSRVASRILSGFGYSDKSNEESAAITVKIQGANKEDAESWSR